MHNCRTWRDILFSDPGILSLLALVVGPITNRYNVGNEETRAYPGVFVCRGLRKPWPEIWEELLHFG